mmetsp:Transcript_32763/g.49379  ORF Transcript_32763/g.49379 Transcript_32763/m.49379 type:complete len:98 (+) Transcript_32763:25-318(+)
MICCTANSSEIANGDEEEGPCPLSGIEFPVDIYTYVLDITSIDTHLKTFSVWLEVRICRDGKTADHEAFLVFLLSNKSNLLSLMIFGRIDFCIYEHN